LIFVEQKVPCFGHENVTTVECRQAHTKYLLRKLHLQVICFRLQC